MKDNYIDPEIIKPKPKKEYYCKGVTFNNSQYNVKAEILGKDGYSNCYYVIWHGLFLILLSYAELD